jgi:hypothetical protein
MSSPNVNPVATESEAEEMSLEEQDDDEDPDNIHTCSKAYIGEHMNCVMKAARAELAYINRRLREVVFTSRDYTALQQQQAIARQYIIDLFKAAADLP